MGKNIWKTMLLAPHRFSELHRVAH